MLAGEAYNFFDSELVARRRAVKELLRIFNAAPEEPEQNAILQRLLGSLGRNSIIEPPFFCTYGSNIHLGEDVFLNAMCAVIDNNEVRVGDHVMVGPLVQIYTAAHPLDAAARNRGDEVARPITIEDNVWVGGGAILLPGVQVGSNAVVGAGAVVTRRVPANTVVAGNPARVIREIDSGSPPPTPGPPRFPDTPGW